MGGPSTTLCRVRPQSKPAGIADLAPVLAPVSEREERDTGLPAGAELPPAIRRVVERALRRPGVPCG
ncbi:hypothetical protein ABTY96_02395 [Streptomyces sp. NPDC096057]|uniref:hypothetical protein n=1 Tax=Streptomyces sp. NPDC096057 TaxID=3155543 RepID=UPI0033239EF8